MKLKRLTMLLAALTICFSFNPAYADLYEFEFWGEADPPGQGEVWSYDGVDFGDNPEAHGKIIYETVSGKVTTFWIDMPTLPYQDGGSYHFEDTTGYPGVYIPQTAGGGPLAGDGDFFSVNGSNLALEFELYYDDRDGWIGHYLIQDPDVQFSIGGQYARASAPSAVPIPGAIWLLISGGLAMAGHRTKIILSQKPQESAK